MRVGIPGHYGLVEDCLKEAEMMVFWSSDPESTNGYASGLEGTQRRFWAKELGIEMVHIPFRGAGPAAQAVLAKTTQVGSVALPAAEPLVQGGQLRALAVTGTKRWFSLPDVPTMIESGFPGFVSDTFNALFAPAGTPPEVVALLVKESRAAFGRPQAIEQAHRAGFEITAGTPEQLAARVAAEIPMVKELVEKAGIKPE